MPRFIFIAGGVMSGVGKGVTTASIGKILQTKGFKVSAIKIDPYINVDAGTMNPIEHGEVFVTDDGTECDQDIGNYERFLEENLSTDNYITTGRVYQAVINRERNLEYNGKCVEVVPDIPNEVISRIRKVARKTKADFVMVEIGGTVGEYQNMLFLEAARMLHLKEPKNVLFVLVSYLPVPGVIGEMKTKPTQSAVRLLNEAGIQPDIIIGRSSLPLDGPRKKKISVFCNVKEQDVISAPDVGLIYEIPVDFEKERLGNQILKKFGLRARKQNIKEWSDFVDRAKNSKVPVKIGMVGKYFKTGSFTLMDSYISVIEAIKHASWHFGRKPVIEWISAEKYDPVKLPDGNNGARKNLKNDLGGLDGVIVLGGFGNRGVEGKIKAIKYCRENNIPYLGLCLGMQLAVIEFARNVCGLKNANSVEFSNDTRENVIDVMFDQKALLKEKKYGATMRLGAYNCRIKKGTIAWKAYQQNGLNRHDSKDKTNIISERHRHRYEVNNKFRTILEDNGMIISGVNPERDLVEIIELHHHPFFVGTQFHPELKSHPLNPHPIFREFIRAGVKKKPRSRG